MYQCTYNNGTFDVFGPAHGENGFQLALTVSCPARAFQKPSCHAIASLYIPEIHSVVPPQVHIYIPTNNLRDNLYRTTRSWLTSIFLIKLISKLTVRHLLRTRLTEAAAVSVHILATQK